MSTENPVVPVSVIYHHPGSPGPRHKRYPQINVAATARLHGISKHQLGKLLTGKARPSIKSLRILASVLGKSLDETWAELKVKPKGKRKRREK